MQEPSRAGVSAGAVRAVPGGAAGAERSVFIRALY